MTDDIIAARKSPELIEYLLKRRSVSIKNMGEPGPSSGQVETILRAAARVSDHGRMFPWYFIVFAGETRREAGELLKRAWRAEEPEAASAKLELEAERFLRAPAVVAVVSRVRRGKHPVWEQVLSAGAACQNLCLAANSLGFGTSWVTEWYAYSSVFKQGLGLDTQDHIAGFIYIGTPKEMPEERERPDMDSIITLWEPGGVLNKGLPAYDEKGESFPEHKFDFPRGHHHGS